jgi:hypothetical protein
MFQQLWYHRKIAFEKSFKLVVSKNTIQCNVNEFNYSFKRVVLIPERRNTIRNDELKFQNAQEMIL